MNIVRAKELLAYYDESRDGARCPSLDSRYEAIKEYIGKKEIQSDDFYALPYRTLEETLYHKKAGYFKIAEDWESAPDEGSGDLLLALADTIEEVSKMIYEIYDRLAVLFKSRLETYLKSDRADIMGALAVLKACRLFVLSPERYVAVACSLRDRAGVAASDADQVFEKSFVDIEAEIRKYWGGMV